MIPTTTDAPQLLSSSAGRLHLVLVPIQAFSRKDWGTIRRCGSNRVLPTPPGSVMRYWFWLLLLAGVIVSQAFLWATDLPLGIPGEWVWQRTEFESDGYWNFAGTGVAAILYLFFVNAGATWFRKAAIKRRNLIVLAWLAGLVAASFAWLWIVQEMSPLRNRHGKSAFVLFYSGSSGYFTKARYEQPDAALFLESYEDLMRERDVLHVGTHPPGLFLVFHGLIQLCHRSPLLAAALDATQPASFREACDIITRNSSRSIPARPVQAADRRVLWLATLLVMAATSLAVLPLFGLLRRTLDLADAWQGAALWPAVPAVAVFIPKSDVVYAFLGLLMVYAWLVAIDRRSVAMAFVAGLLVWCGLMLSLAFLPVMLFMAIISWNASLKTGVVDHAENSRVGLRSWLTGAPPCSCLLAAAAGFLIPTLWLGWAGQINLFMVWLLNYQNHAGFYAHYPRTYWKWLLANPIELAMATGWPIALLSASFLGRNVRAGSLLRTPVAFGVVAVCGLLWLSGKNSGEAARLWIVFVPWLVWMAGEQLAQLEHGATRTRFRPSAIVLALQLFVCALTVARVSGFDL